MKWFMNSSLVVAGLLLCLSGGMALKERGKAASALETPDRPITLGESVGARGTRAVLLPGQTAIIQVSGTTFDRGNFNGRYTEASNSAGLRLYRLGSTDRWCGYCPRSRQWVIGWTQSSVQGGLGIYYSPAGGHNTIPISGWRASRVWPGSSPAPTVSVLGVPSDKFKRG